MVMKRAKSLRYYVTSFLAASLVINTFSCSFKSPKAPSWKMQLTIPLIAKKYTVAELADKEKNLKVDSTGILEYVAEQSIPRQEIGDRLNIGPYSKEKALAMRSIYFPSPGSQSIEFQLFDIYPQAEKYNGQVVVVPAFDFMPISLNI